MGKTISPQMILRFEHHLKENERSKTTICKYLHDVAEFKLFSDNRAMDKNIVLAYKAELLKKYAASSANSMLAVLNSFSILCTGEI